MHNLLGPCKAIALAQTTPKTRDIAANTLSCLRVFALFGIGALLFVLLARPQEYFESLQRVPLLYAAAGAAFIGVLSDIALRRTPLRTASTLPWAFALAAWTVIVNVQRVPEHVLSLGLDMAVLLAVYAVIAHGAQSFRALRIVSGILVATTLVISAICFHQGFAERQCVQIDPVNAGEGTPDGRPCIDNDICYTGDSEPGAEYRCEKVGFLGTYSIEDRVRYRGELHDPNELALTLVVFGLALLIAFAAYAERGTVWLGVTVGTLLLVGTVWLTQSRGGLVVVLIVPGVYLARRFGARSIVAAMLAGGLLLAVGGRSGERAETSTMLRYEAWSAGLQMWKDNPIFGVGQRQFGEHHSMTAHNSYVLAMAELGFVGLMLFLMIGYVAAKSLIVIMWHLRREPEARIAHAWGMALLAGLAGVAFQIGTLSFAYHSVLWILLGLIGAWQGAVRRHRPDLAVRIGLGDVAMVGAAAVGFVVVILPLFLRWKHAL